jgi:hypothetical protein
MLLPSKLQSGQNFKTATVNTVNQIIEYLKSQRLVADNKTIRLNQLTSGIAISALPQTSHGGKSAGSATFEHPFQLHIKTDENGKQQLCIRQGRVYHQTVTFTYVGIEYDEVDGVAGKDGKYVNFDWESTSDGIYCIVGAAFNTGSGTTEKIECTVLVCTGSIYVQDIPCVTGYYPFYIGSVIKNSTISEEGETTYSLSVLQQRLTNDLVITDQNARMPFVVRVFVDHGDTKALKSSIADWNIARAVCCDGVVFDINSNVSYTLKDAGHTPTAGYNYCLLHRYYAEDGGETWEIKWMKTFQPFVKTGEVVTDTYIPLALLENNEPIYLFQFQIGNLVYGADTFMTKVDNGEKVLDLKPGFLIDKIQGDVGTLFGQSENTGEQGELIPGYIGVWDRAAGENTEKHNRCLMLKWQYDQISGFSSDKYSTLNLVNGLPTFEDQGKIRISVDEKTSRFLPDALAAGEHIKLDVGSKITISAEPPTITGQSPITVLTQNGWDFTIGLDTSNLVTSVSAGTCIDISGSKNTPVISVDKGCVFSDFEITGSSPIKVTGGGDKWDVALDTNGLITGVKNGDCIVTSVSDGIVTIGVDKNCIFSNFTITGDKYINVTGSGDKWDLTLNATEISSKLGKVAVSITDVPDYLETKFDNNDLINFQSTGTIITAELGSQSIISGDESISVTITNGFADIRDLGKVAVVDGDTPGFLEEKLQNNDLINFQSAGDSITAELGSQSIISGDESISVEITNGFADIRDKGKVAVAEGDTPGFLVEKIVVDQNLAPFLDIENTGTQLNLKLTATGSGLMILENGRISVLNAPWGNAVLACSNGSFSWIPYSECENSCDNEE